MSRLEDFINLGNKNAWQGDLECEADVTDFPSILSSVKGLSVNQVPSDDITFWADDYNEEPNISSLFHTASISSSKDEGATSVAPSLKELVDDDFGIEDYGFSPTYDEQIKAMEYIGVSCQEKSNKNKPGFVPIEVKEKGSISVKDLNAFVKEVLSEGDFITINKDVFYYNGRYWVNIDKDDLTIILKRDYREETTHLLSICNYTEVYNQIKTDVSIRVDKFPAKDGYYINFKNGVYDVMHGKLLDHSRDYYFFSCINRDFNRTNMKGEVFEDYISRCSRFDQAIRQALLQMLGYIISDLNKAKAFFVLLGDRDSGKSTFGNLIISIIGEENRAALNFHELASKWIPATLRNKKLVLDMDVSCEEVSKDLVAIVNKLTGNDAVVGQEKYKNPFTFKNECKILLGANTLPTLHHTKHEEAFVKRMVVIPFGETIPDECKDPELLEKLQGEADYIITLAMDALKDLINNNFQFPVLSDAEAFKRSVLYESIPSPAEIVSDFVKSCCIIDPHYFTTTADLYSQYLNCCKSSEYNRRPLDISHFGMELSKILGDQAKIKHQQQSGFCGIRLLT